MYLYVLMLLSRSSHAVPECLRPLMLDETSEIIDYYPQNFHVDLKGKKFAWLGEVILPFIDEQRLVNAGECRLNIYIEIDVPIVYKN